MVNRSEIGFDGVEEHAGVWERTNKLRVEWRGRKRGVTGRGMAAQILIGRGSESPMDVEVEVRAGQGIGLRANSVIDSRISVVGRGEIRKARVREKLGNSREEVEGSNLGIGGGRDRDGGQGGCCGESRRLREREGVCRADLG